MRGSAPLWEDPAERYWRTRTYLEFARFAIWAGLIWWHILGGQVVISL